MEVRVADGADWVRPNGTRVARGFVPDGVRIILDTDIASDVDDVGAIALLHGMANLDDCEILATVVTSPCEYSPGALDTLNIWHGRGSLPIGYTDAGISGCGGTNSNFTEPLYNGFPRNVGLANTVDPAVGIYRTALAAAPDDSVTIVTIGFLTSLSGLLDSSGDAIDARNGVDLVAAKCDEVFIMGGGMAYDGRETPEFNLRGDSAASANVVDKCPVPITFNPWEIGNAVKTGKRDGKPDTHIVYVAYDEFGASASGGRSSWDAVTVLQAVRGNEGRYSTVTGTMTVDANDGEDSFTENAQGPHRYTFLDTAASNIEDEIEPLIWNDQVGD